MRGADHEAMGIHVVLGRMAGAMFGLDQKRAAAVVEYGLVVALVLAFALLLALAPGA